MGVEQMVKLKKILRIFGILVIILHVCFALFFAILVINWISIGKHWNDPERPYIPGKDTIKYWDEGNVELARAPDGDVILFVDDRSVNHIGHNSITAVIEDRANHLIAFRMQSGGVVVDLDDLSCVVLTEQDCADGTYSHYYTDPPDPEFDVTYFEDEIAALSPGLPKAA